MAADRTVKVTLSAEVSQYLQSMLKAAKATEDVGDKGKKSSEKTSSAFGRLLETAEKNNQAWTAVGTTMLTAGAAVTAIGAAALATGISYNTLQQTTRAALTTVLGSAEAAADQMDRLDDFARNSPFSKSTFITAQQQMLAFGIETNKVIPYLDAIQNAVAAAGGSNQEIAELSEIFAKIQGSAKITAEDLNEFGIRGVNAAELIGSQMGKTGAQIRDDITNGSLDATTALDALALGMTASFDGAADGVKNTFVGAVDRVTAAWRDFSAELATPLVDPNGGGALVDLLNWAADTMRAFQALPEPLQNTALAVTGVSTAVLLLSGAFLTGLPRLAAFNASLNTIAASSRTGAVAVTALKIAAGAAATALTVAAIGLTIWATKQAEAKARTDEYIATLDAMGAKTEATADKITSALAGSTDSWVDGNETLIDSAERMGISLSDLVGYINGQEAAIERVEAAQSRYLEGDSLWGKANAERSSEIGTLKRGLDEQADALAEAQRRIEQKAEVAAAAGDIESDWAGKSQEATLAIEAQTAALEEQEKAAEQWREAVTSAFQSFIDPSGAFQAAIDKNKEFAEATADATKSSKDSWEDYYDGQKVTAKQYIAQLREQVEAQEAWAENMTALTARAGTGMTAEMREAARQMIDELLELGPDGAAQVALLRDLSDKEFAKVVELYARKGKASADSFADSVEREPPVVMEVTADTASAYEKARAVYNYINGLNATIGVTADRHISTGRGGSGGITFNATGGPVGFAGGGRVPGTPPADPMADNILARTQHGSTYAIRSGEFIQSQPATDYYGLGAMYAINSRRIPREVLAGFAHGGQIPTTSPAVTASRGVGRPVEVSRTYDVTFVSRNDLSEREVRQGLLAVEALDLPGGEWG